METFPKKGRDSDKMLQLYGGSLDHLQGLPQGFPGPVPQMRDPTCFEMSLQILLECQGPPGHPFDFLKASRKYKTSGTHCHQELILVLRLMEI
jgi:hypothetical protein